MGIFEQYKIKAIEHLGLIENEEKNILAAAKILAEIIKKDGLIHLFGTDPHAASEADEFFYKPLGLANINPIYDPAFSFSHGSYRTSLCQNLDSLAETIIDYYEYIEKDEAIILVSSNPKGKAFNEAIKRAKEKELKIITLTSGNFENKGLVDVIIDSHIKFEAEDISFAPVAISAIFNALTAETKKLAKDAVIWKGKGAVDIVESKEAIDKYLFKIRHL